MNDRDEATLHPGQALEEAAPAFRSLVSVGDALQTLIEEDGIRAVCVALEHLLAGKPDGMTPGEHEEWNASLKALRELSAEIA